MYGAVLARLGPRLAPYAAAVLYALMILATIYCALEPQADFNYIRL